MYTLFTLADTAIKYPPQPDMSVLAHMEQCSRETQRTRAGKQPLVVSSMAGCGW